MTLVRSRHCDGGRAGGTTGLVNTPASNSFRQKSNVFSNSPIRNGTMGVSVVPMSKPSDRRPSWRRRAFAHSESRRSGSRCRMCSAARTPAVLDGGSAVAPRAEHADRVCVVDRQDGAVALRDLEQRRYVGDVAFHRVDAVDDDHLPDAGGNLLDLALELRHVAVAEPLGLAV